MNLIQFETVKFESLGEIVDLVQNSINNIYPKYYPRGAVEFFLKLHSLNEIENNYDKETVIAVLQNDTLVGTGSIRENDIKRVFILPKYQGKGIGTNLMNELERRIFSRYSVIDIDASLPAYNFYLKRNYISTEYITLETKYNQYLCYHHMQKRGGK